MPWKPLDRLSCRHDWFIKNGAVYFSGTGTAKKLRGCDARSFEAFDSADCLLCRDRHAVYCEHETSLKPLKGSDAASFRFVGADYAADDFHAYYAGRRLKTTQPGRLRLLSDVYASDGESVFFDGAALRGADPATWQRVAQSCFSRDRSSVFFGARKLPFADPSSWEIITGIFSKDSKRVYHMNHVLPGENPAEWDASRARSQAEAAGACNARPLPVKPDTHPRHCFT